MMRVSGWKTIALAVLMAGILGGCGGGRIAELEVDLAKVTKESNECKAKNVKLEERFTRLGDEERTATFERENATKKLEKEIEELKTQLAAK